MNGSLGVARGVRVLAPRSANDSSSERVARRIAAIEERIMSLLRASVRLQSRAGVDQTLLMLFEARQTYLMRLDLLHEEAASSADGSSGSG